MDQRISDQKNPPSTAQPPRSSEHSNPDKAQISAAGRNKEVVHTGGTPASNSAPVAEGGKDRSLVGIISESFPPFDAQLLIVTPFEEETANDAKLEEELTNMLLSTLLTTHAWMTARPKHEADIASHQLEDEIKRIIARERQQGMSFSPSLPTLPAASSSAPSSAVPALSSSSSVRRRGLVDETRERLRDFVERMKTALTALLGVTPITE